MLIAYDGELRGMIAVADTVKASARSYPTIIIYEYQNGHANW